MTLWTPTKQPRNGHLLNSRFSSDTEWLNRHSVDAAGMDVALYIRHLGWGNHKREWVVEEDEGRDEEPNEYDIVTTQANTVSLARSSRHSLHVKPTLQRRYK